MSVIWWLNEIDRSTKHILAQGHPAYGERQTDLDRTEHLKYENTKELSKYNQDSLFLLALRQTCS